MAGLPPPGRGKIIVGAGLRRDAARAAIVEPFGSAARRATRKRMTHHHFRRWGWRAGLAALLLGPPALSQTPGAGEPRRESPSRSGPAFELQVNAPQPVRGLLDRHLELRLYREVSDLDDAEIARLLVMAERDVRQLVGTLGHFRPQIQITRQPGNPPRIVVAVDPGPVSVVRRVDIGFAGDIATRADPSVVAQREGIRTGWGLPTGQGFDQTRWDDAKAEGLRSLVRKRYLAGRIAHSLADIDAPADTAHLEVRFDSGPLYRLGPMVVNGVERYDPVLVPRLARLDPGMEYDADRIQQAQLRLAGSGYFDSAFFYVDPLSDPAAAPVQVTLREAPLQKVVLGVGLTTDSGPRASVEHTHNRLPGLGWRAVTKVQAEKKNPFAQTEWTAVPDERGWRWSVLARGERVEDDDLITNGQRLRFGRFRVEDHIDRNMYLQYDRASVRSVSGAPISAADAGDGSAISANYVWTGRYFDNLISPTRGHGIGFELGGGLTLAGDRQPFQRTVARWLQLRPLASGRLQLRAEGGMVIARGSAKVPSTQLFRTGGDTSVRGYGYREIGVALPDGRTGPGRLMAVGSVEWQRPILRKGLPSDLESAVFVDAGAVGDLVRDLKPHVGVGAGVRWNSPVGPVEASLAYGVKAKKVRLHMTVGFTF
jgi:translocation and assembly module TamA